MKPKVKFFKTSGGKGSDRSNFMWLQGIFEIVPKTDYWEPNGFFLFIDQALMHAFNLMKNFSDPEKPQNVAHVRFL
jgi:hypothetical protein